MKSFSIASAAFFLILSSSSLQAGFTDEFDLGALVDQQLSSSGSVSFGEWTAGTTIINTAHATVDTTNAPNQVTLAAFGDMDADFMSVAELTFSSGVFSSAMTVSFDTLVFFDTLVSANRTWAAEIRYNGGTVALAEGVDSYSFVVDAGSTLEFWVHATGYGTTSLEGGLGEDPGEGPGGNVEGYPSDVSLTLSNFTATSAIPEPSTYGFLMGGLALAGAFAGRRRRGNAL